jgi:UDP-glucose:(heptosyl)LPS alpha-1,3-glucosyltransferase
MPTTKLTIAFARRGYSASGGAERYLKRLADGVARQGYQTRLFATSDWPAKDASFSEVVRLRGKSPLDFAHELEKMRENARAEMLVSLERVCRCDVYRAGDGVHQAWLNRREKYEMPWRRLARRFKSKHRDLVRLEEALLQERGANRVIANSRMVKGEIMDLYNFRRDMIDVVPNGIPLEQFRFDPVARAHARQQMGLGDEHIGLLFAGTGWERKGLRFALEAMRACEDPRLKLFVAGRGNSLRYRQANVQFLGEVPDLRPLYSGADIFVLPTIYDPFSNACLEAMASGLPVITSRANGFSEVMEDRIHGSIVDRPDETDDLRNAIQAWSDPTRRQVARPSILKRAANFDISRNVERTLEILLQSAASASLT